MTEEEKTEETTEETPVEATEEAAAPEADAPEVEREEERRGGDDDQLDGCHERRHAQRLAGEDGAARVMVSSRAS